MAKGLYVMYKNQVKHNMFLKLWLRVYTLFIYHILFILLQIKGKKYYKFVFLNTMKMYK